MMRIIFHFLQFSTMLACCVWRRLNCGWQSIVMLNKQVVKVIWYKTALPPLTDGSIVFTRWRQCAHVRGHIGGTWRIWLKCASFGPPESTTQTANRSVQPFLHSSQQSVPILYNGRPFSPNFPFPRGMWTPPSNTWFLGPLQAHKPNGISISSAVFAQMSTEFPCTLQWDAPFPLKIAAFHGGSGPHLIHGSLGPPKSSTQMASRSVQPF